MLMLLYTTRVSMVRNYAVSFLFSQLYLVDIFKLSTSISAGDLNETYFVGQVDDVSQKLVRCTYECLEKAISIGMIIMSEYSHLRGRTGKMLIVTVNFLFITFNHVFVNPYHCCFSLINSSETYFVNFISDFVKRYFT